jgi:hypothetical protein
MSLRTGLRQKIVYRIWGLPRNLHELDAATLLVGTMRRVGWSRSVKFKILTDLQGAPLPWWTYPTFEWLQSVLRGASGSLEVASGQSTAAARVGP